MAAIAGILGNDRFPMRDLKELCEKWYNTEWLPEVAALEIARSKAMLLIPECKEAIEYYRPEEPKEFKAENETLLQFQIRLCKVE